MHTHLHKHAHTPTQTCTHTYTKMPTLKHAQTQTCTYTYTNMHTQTCTHPNMHIYTNKHTRTRSHPARGELTFSESRRKGKSEGLFNLQPFIFYKKKYSDNGGYIIHPNCPIDAISFSVIR